MIGFWIVVGVVAWLLVSAVACVVIGRVISQSKQERRDVPPPPSRQDYRLAR